LELSVAVEYLKKARANQEAQQRDIDGLMGELGKTSVMARANLKRIMEKFREQTNAAIHVATATALQGWTEQAAKLQVLRADKANWDLRGPRFWKLSKANCEAIQKNLTMDFLRLALIHREEVTKLLGEHDDLVWKMQMEMEAVAEPMGPVSQPTEGVEEDDDEQTADEQEPMNNRLPMNKSYD
jgi:hypothetical protein